MIIYTVRESEGIVEAQIVDAENAVIDALCRYHNDTSFQYGELAKLAKISNVYTGKAKCHPEDTFDVNIGKQLARKRVLEKYTEAYMKAMSRVDNLFDRRQHSMMLCINKSIEKNKKLMR